jgi:hypothetical protein
MKRKYKKWTVKELGTLKELVHQGYSVKQISDKLNRPTYCIYKQLEHSNIKYSKQLPKGDKWSKDEYKYLIENHKRYTIDELAGKLGRSYSSVLNKINQLGLEKSWLPYEDNLLLELYPKFTPLQISKLFLIHRSFSQITKRLNLLKKE